MPLSNFGTLAFQNANALTLSLVPLADNTVALGDASHRFTNIYAAFAVAAAQIEFNQYLAVINQFVLRATGVDGKLQLEGWTSATPMLLFGGATSSFPAIKRVGTTMQVRLADDSAYAAASGSAFKARLGDDTNYDDIEIAFVSTNPTLRAKRGGTGGGAGTLNLVIHGGNTIDLHPNGGSERLTVATTAVYGDSASRFSLGIAGAEFKQLYLDRTNTAGGTTGAQTINKALGSVNFAAAASSLVVTNSLVAATSHVFAVIETNDDTATIENVVCGAGSFTINLTAAATAETRVGFLVLP